MTNSNTTPTTLAYFTHFKHGMELVRVGRRDEAYNVFSSLYKSASNSHNTQSPAGSSSEVSILLLWLAFTAPDLADAQKAVEAAALVDPTNPNINPARSWLSEQQRQRLGKLLCGRS